MSARTPYQLNVRDLIRHPGDDRHRTLEFALPERFGEGLVAVPEGEPVRIELHIESVHEGLYASGTVRTAATGECARCLAPLRLAVEVEFGELFAYPSEEPFDHELPGDVLDIEPVVRDSVVLSLPFQPVCVDGCEEIDLGPGIALITGEAQEPLDERWAALEGFGADEDEPGSRG